MSGERSLLILLIINDGFTCPENEKMLNKNIVFSGLKAKLINNILL